MPYLLRYLLQRNKNRPYRAGQSLEEMQKTLTLDAYKDWGQYDAWRIENIQGMHERIRMQRRGN